MCIETAIEFKNEESLDFVFAFGLTIADGPLAIFGCCSALKLLKKALPGVSFFNDK
jgi:hypothetical protein